MVDSRPSLSFQIVSRVQAVVGPILTWPDEVAAVAEVTAEKSPDHRAHRIDELADATLMEVIESQGFKGRVYSEEGGWIETGAQGYVVCDPYCNTSLTFRGFREAAVAACEADADGRFVSAAIADLQTRRVVHASGGSASVSTQRRDGAWSTSVARTSGVTRLADSFVVLSALKRKRRSTELVGSGLVRAAGMLHTVDGAIMIARLALADIDVYADPFYGQPLYELPCMEIVRAAGGIVTDRHGTPLTLGSLIRRLEKEPAARQSMVMAATRALHEEVLAALG